MRWLSHCWRYAWASPATAVGAVVSIAAFCGGARGRFTSGTMEIAGGCIERVVDRLPRPLRFGAITLGHVIIGIDHATLHRVRTHEQVHVRQYERWGFLFFPLYLGSSMLALMRGRDPYHDNVFERQAFSSTTSAEARGPSPR